MPARPDIAILTDGFLEKPIQKLGWVKHYHVRYLRQDISVRQQSKSKLLSGSDTEIFGSNFKPNTHTTILLIPKSFDA